MGRPSASFLLGEIKSAIIRFPLSFICAISCTILCVYWVELLSDRDAIPYFFPALFTTLLLGVPLFILTELIVNAISLNAAKIWGCRLFSILLLVGYYFYYDKSGIDISMVGGVRTLLLFISLHAFIAYVALKDRALSNWWRFNISLFTRFILGAVFSAAVFVGLVLAVLAVDNLFGFSIDDSIYGQLFIAVIGLLLTTYVLAGFPHQKDLDGLENYNKVLRIFVKFILIPLTILYFIILYTYAAKLGVNWAWPVGWVSKLVLGFSIIGIFTYLLAFLLPDEDIDGISGRFKKIYFPALLPMGVLMVAAIWRRVSEYGFTEPRVIVLVSAIAIIGLACYFIFSKKDNIKIIPLALGVITLLMAIGPQNIFTISENSQKQELQSLFEQLEMWKDGKVVPTIKDTVSEVSGKRVSSILNYFENSDRLDRISEWFPVKQNENMKSSFLLESVNLKAFVGYGANSISPVLIDFKIDEQEGVYVDEAVTFYRFALRQKGLFTSGDSIRLSLDKGVLKVNHFGTVELVSIIELSQRIANDFQGVLKSELPQKTMRIDLTSGGQLQLISINGREQNNTMMINNIRGYLILPN